MKKLIVILIMGTLIITSLVLGSKIFSKYFFNESYSITPNITGLTYENARKQLQNTSFKLKIAGEGTSELEPGKIYSQIPTVGKKTKSGRIIRVWISKGKVETSIPDFHGLDIIDAKALAEKNGIRIANIVYVHHPLQFKKVVASDPAAGEPLKNSRSVTLLVSMEAETKDIYMPDLIGIDLNQAKDLLRANNLVPGEIVTTNDDNMENDIVLDTTPSAGEKILSGTVIKLIVNKK